MIATRRRRSSSGTATRSLSPAAPTAPDPHTLFSFDDVRVERGGRIVLDLDQAVIPTDGGIAIIGPSGSGKSTLLRLCNRLEAPSAGTVRYRGEDLSTMDPTDLRRRVAMVFQQPIALDGTAADNLRAADPTIEEHGIETALARVGLAGTLASSQARDLSGGERQRLGLARSLTTEPEVLLLDEATSALDPSNAARIEQLVAGLADDGITPVWVTHDLEQLQRIARNVLVIVAGRVVQHGPVEDVLAHPIPEVDRFLRGEDP